MNVRAPNLLHLKVTTSQSHIFPLSTDIGNTGIPSHEDCLTPWNLAKRTRELQGSSLGVSAFHLIIGSYLAASELLANLTPRLADISSRLPLDEGRSFCSLTWGMRSSPACHMYRAFLATINLTSLWSIQLETCGDRNMKGRCHNHTGEIVKV